MLKLRGCQKTLLASVCLLFVSSAMGRVQEKILHTFEGPDGNHPYELISDSAGNIYGAAVEGGTTDNGTVFELSPTSGGWNFSVLYSFLGGNDGVYPAGLVMDGNGNLYGTTNYGGTYGLGTVFELTPSLQGQWNETVLYSFGGYQGDGIAPLSGVILDAAGNLYGTTPLGGSLNCASGCGTVYELTPAGNGQWSESILYSFLGGEYGDDSDAGLTFDGLGNLFGTASYGGRFGCRHGCGIVFELMPSQGGGWAEKTIYAFDGRDGATPISGVVFDPAGNLYGEASFGGMVPCNTTNLGCGTVFRLSPDGSGGWSFNVLHQFGGPGDGAIPAGGLAFDKHGSLYGATSEGGTGFGSVFQLKRSGGKVVETIYGNFGGADGQDPEGVLIDNAGNVYGTTLNSDPGDGILFELTK
jgi:uncharacterized repeat protein (TIGR03803 family)